MRKKLSYNELVDRLSPEVRKDIVLKMSKATLMTVWCAPSPRPARPLRNGGGRGREEEKAPASCTIAPAIAPARAQRTAPAS